MRFAPAARMASRSSSVRIPPDALTPISGPTTRRISATSCTVAPWVENPVEVLTKSAPACLLSIAGGDLLIVVEQGGFENHFDQRSASVSGGDHGRDVGANGVEIARAQLADIQNHVDFPRSRRRSPLPLRPL